MPVSWPPAWTPVDADAPLAHASPLAPRTAATLAATATLRARLPAARLSLTLSGILVAVAYR
jgi:hypothetical protein